LALTNPTDLCERLLAMDLDFFGDANVAVGPAAAALAAAWDGTNVGASGGAGEGSLPRHPLLGPLAEAAADVPRFKEKLETLSFAVACAAELGCARADATAFQNACTTASALLHKCPALGRVVGGLDFGGPKAGAGHMVSNLKAIALVTLEDVRASAVAANADAASAEAMASGGWGGTAAAAQEKLDAALESPRHLDRFIKVRGRGEGESHDELTAAPSRDRFL
jgi:hypothetical protein